MQFILIFFSCLIIMLLFILLDPAVAATSFNDEVVMLVDATDVLLPIRR